MTWPPTRPVRRRLFGVVFLAVWVGGMYLCWGWRSEGPWIVIDDPVVRTERSGGTYVVFDLSISIDEYRIDRFGFGGWLAMARTHTGLPWDWAGDPPVERFWIEPRGFAAALIMTAVSSLILYVAWRAAVSAFTCAAGTCDACGYDLTGLAPPRCPECGETRGACA